MRNMMVVWILALILVVAAGCDSGNSSNSDTVAADTHVAPDNDLSTAPDTGADVVLPVCTDEVELTGQLPCDCYGTVATDPAAQVPGCITQVVCCPAIQGLKCEDYEHLEPSPEIVEDASGDTGTDPDGVALLDVVEETAAGEVTDTVEEIAPPAVCPNELDLSSYVPCTCKGTLVLDVKVAMPTCTKKVVCCPFDGLKCE